MEFYFRSMKKEFHMMIKTTLEIGGNYGM